MNGLRVEERELGINTSLSLDIAKHMAERLDFGPTVVVSRQPAALLASTRKQWLKVLRLIENRHAAIAGTTSRKVELASKIARMEQANFAAKSPSDLLLSDILFATAEQLLEFAPECRTLYVATPTEKEILHKITSFMPGDGLVIVYRLTRQ